METKQEGFTYFKRVALNGIDEVEYEAISQFYPPFGFESETIAKDLPKGSSLKLEQPELLLTTAQLGSYTFSITDCPSRLRNTICLEMNETKDFEYKLVYSNDIGFTMDDIIGYCGYNKDCENGMTFELANSATNSQKVTWTPEK